MFFFLSSGIFSDPSCVLPDSEIEVTHAVVLVGYGTQKDTDYWIVRM